MSLTKHEIDGVEIHTKPGRKDSLTIFAPSGWDGDQLVNWRLRNIGALNKLRVIARAGKEDVGDEG